MCPEGIQRKVNSIQPVEDNRTSLQAEDLITVICQHHKELVHNFHLTYASYVIS